MPFTISHAAAALPFRRTKLVISAVIVGCMAPDFEYFLHAGMYGRESHNVPGAFDFALPATLIVLVLFHGLLKRSLSTLLPERVQERIVFEKFTFWPISRFLWIVLSALVGIATHLIWDSFTHEHRWAVEHIAWLRNTVVVFHREVGYYKFIQSASTLVGLAILAWWLWDWYRKAPKRAVPSSALSSSARVWTIGLMLVTAAVLAFWRAQALSAPRPIYSGKFVANAVVAFVSVLSVELFLFCVALRARMSSTDRALDSSN